MELAAEVTSSAPVVEAFECEKCGKTFNTKQGLSMHITRSHSKKKRYSSAGGRKSGVTRKPATEQKLFQALGLNGEINDVQTVLRVAAWINEGLELSRL